MINNGSRSSVEIIQEDLRGVDSQVMIDRCQEVTGTTVPLDNILAARIRCADEPPSLDTTTEPNVAKRSGPVISAGLLGASSGTCVTGAGAAVGSPPDFPAAAASSPGAPFLSLAFVLLLAAMIC